ncbi:MAG: SDR family NAD(P)-dependent oxidoreductase [Bacteroidetes bacterium]|nr:SDR family NAD(P)-dependent oxidoreductase [Bacteroidota bacterium]
MSASLKDTVALVTGASKGIGRAVAELLAAEGAKVVLTARNAELLVEVERGIIAAGGTAAAIPADVTSEHSVSALVLETKRRFGTIDVLINNAGVATFTSVEQTTTDEYDAMMNVNLKGVFLCSRAVLPVMRAKKRGMIVNVASLAGKNSLAGGSVYSATKWGLIGFSRSLMLEVRDDNIRVVTVAPGSVNTGFANKERNDPTIIQPADVAGTVLFALTMPDRVNVSEIDIRPTIPARKGN